MGSKKSPPSTPPTTPPRNPNSSSRLERSATPWPSPMAMPASAQASVRPMTCTKKPSAEREPFCICRVASVESGM